jgi:hypothetical protein
MRPTRYLLWMAVILIAVIAALIPIRAELVRFFNASPVLNGIILLVMLAGVAYAFAQVLMLRPEVRWAQAFRAHTPLPERTPPLMRSAARVLGSKEKRRERLTASTLRSLLEQIGLRLEERRDIARYIMAVLVLLGLMGTFWGLINTVDAVTDVIRGLTVTVSDDFVRTFERFKSGLLDTLRGSAVAFSCAMFGLGGAVVLGALEVQAQQAQNRFYGDIEEWFTELTKVRLDDREADGDSVESVSRYLETMLESASTSLSELNRTISAHEAERVQTTDAMKTLGERLAGLVDQLDKQQELLRRLGDAQVELRPILGRLTDEQAFGRQELVTALRTEFKALGNRIAEVQMQSRPYFEQLARESAANRQDLVRQIRSETEGIVKSLARSTAKTE